VSIQDDIERLCQERQMLWAEGRADEAAEAGKKIEALYAKKRHALADHGSAAARDAVMRRAKIEEQLERLMRE
jgi:hypothetical protein